MQILQMKHTVVNIGSRFISSLYEGKPLDQIMTFGFLSLIVYTFYALSSHLSAMLEFCTIFPLVAIASKVIMKYSEKIAFWLNDNVFFYHKVNKGAFDDKKRLSKFKDQCWQLFLHTTSLCLEIPILMKEPWIRNLDTLWEPCPVSQIITPLTELAYMFELAAYTFTGIAHRFFSVRKNDYYVMYGHHIATVMLISGSYVTKCFRVGIVVMFLHDISDFITDITQLLNHSHMEGSEYYYSTEILFVIMLSTWIYTRLYILPFGVIKSILLNGHKACALKHPGEPWIYPHCEGITFWVPGMVLLSILVCMHAYWISLFLKILYKVIRADGTNKGDIYEGDSHSS